jgi:CheY-like chemotaxis protein
MTLISARSQWNARETVTALAGACQLRHPNRSGGIQAGSASDADTLRERGARFPDAPSVLATPLSGTGHQTKAANVVQKRILIADDDSMVRGSLTAVLESEGYVVDQAHNGIEAVRCAIEHSPDLVLLDLNMPHWDGWTAFSQLDRVAPLLPVIVITARPNQYEKAVRLGVDAFMEKPLNIPILVGAIKRLTREDKNRHVGRITNTRFVTQLLGSTEAGR